MADPPRDLAPPLPLNPGDLNDPLEVRVLLTEIEVFRASFPPLSIDTRESLRLKMPMLKGEGMPGLIRLYDRDIFSRLTAKLKKR